MTNGKLYFELDVLAAAPHQAAIDALTAQLTTVDPTYERYNWGDLNNIPYPADPKEQLAYMNAKLASTGSNLIVADIPPVFVYCFIGSSVFCYLGIQAALNGTPWVITVQGSSGPIECAVRAVLALDTQPSV